MTQRKPIETKIPKQITKLVGRDDNLNALLQLLIRSEVRLLTITGFGGIGKTRLALELIPLLQEYFVDGIFFVSFDSVKDKDQIIPTIIRTLGIKINVRKPSDQELKQYLKNRNLLLVLDNFEQLISASHQVKELLLEAVGLKILLTSRLPLKLEGEYVYTVPPLASPIGDLNRLSLNEKTLQIYPALDLFCQRAKQVRPDFSLTMSNIKYVAAICSKLDGVPLALELAAARVQILSPHTLLLRLEKTISILDGREVEPLNPRQQTMRASLEWIYRTLSPAEKRTLQYLSIFHGSWTLEAAEALLESSSFCRDPDRDEIPMDFIFPVISPGGHILTLLQGLVEKSLVVVEEVNEGEVTETLFRLLETIRQFGEEKLQENPPAEVKLLHLRHLKYLSKLAEAYAAELNGPRQQLFISKIEREWFNIETIVNWAINEGEVTDALCLLAALDRFWLLNRYSEGLHFLEDALKAPLNLNAQTKAVRARALLSAATLCLRIGNSKLARNHLTECLKLNSELDNTAGTALALNRLGNLEEITGNLEKSIELQKESYTLFQSLGDKNGMANCLNSMGVASNTKRDYDYSLIYFEKCLELRRKLGDQQLIGISLVNLSTSYTGQSKFKVAISLIEEALAIFKFLEDQTNIKFAKINLAENYRLDGDLNLARKILEEILNKNVSEDNFREKGYLLLNLGLVLCDLSEFGHASACLQQALVMFEELEDTIRISSSILALARIAYAQKLLHRAVILASVSKKLREESGTKWASENLSQYEFLIDSTKAQLGQDLFVTLFEKGLVLSCQQALTYNISEGEYVNKDEGRNLLKFRESLSKRELEVLKLAATGLSNAQIAEKLVLSKFTVNTHLHAINNKFGVRSRTAAISFALQHNVLK